LRFCRAVSGTEQDLFSVLEELGLVAASAPESGLILFLAAFVEKFKSRGQVSPEFPTGGFLDAPPVDNSV
jgi:hypothetical protein